MHARNLAIAILHGCEASFDIAMRVSTMRVPRHGKRKRKWPHIVSEFTSTWRASYPCLNEDLFVGVPFFFVKGAFR